MTVEAIFIWPVCTMRKINVKERDFDSMKVTPDIWHTLRMRNATRADSKCADNGKYEQLMFIIDKAVWDGERGVP